MSRTAPVVVVMMFLTASEPAATVFAPREFSELVRAAPVIVYGQVVDTRARETADRLRVETLVTLRVASYLKGNLGTEVTFVVPEARLGATAP